MADITELGLTEEGPVEVLWDAPEADAFPPRVFPGDYNVRFKLNEQEPFRGVERQDPPQSGNKIKVLEVCWTAVLDAAQLPATALVQPRAEGDSAEIEIPFQRTNFYKHPKRMISDGDDLIRHAGQRIEGGVTNAARMDVLRTMDGRATVGVGLGWDAYCKSCGDMGKDATVASYKRKGATMWPRDAQGKYELTAPCPSCGKKMYARETVRQFKNLNG